MAKVNTVLGEVDVQDLGITLMHEHFMFAFGGWEGQTVHAKTNEEIMEVAKKVAEKVKKFGVKTIVDPTSIDSGRNPELLKKIAEVTGLNVIMCTGYSFEAMGANGYLRFQQSLGVLEDELYELYYSEITKGYKDTGIKPAFIKVGVSNVVNGGITPFEVINLTAAGKVSAATGCPVHCHTSDGQLAPEAADIILAAGASPQKVVMYHMCGNSDIKYHTSVLKKGVYCAFDRFGLDAETIAGGVGESPKDADRVAVLIGLLGANYEKQLMMSHDTVNVWLGCTPPDWYINSYPSWHVTHIFEDIIPQMKSAGVTQTKIDQMLIENPKNLFTV